MCSNYVLMVNNNIEDKNEMKLLIKGYFTTPLHHKPCYIKVESIEFGQRKSIPYSSPSRIKE